jgi:hypothetical protein
VALCLFNDEAYHLLHLGDDEQVVAIEGRAADGHLVGTASGVLVGSTWTSGHRAPFGGFDLARDWTTPAEVGAFVDDVLDGLRGHGVTIAAVRTKPASWSAAEPVLQQALLARGFAVEQAELNFHIDVATRHADGYAASLKKEARKALHRAQGLGLAFDLLDDAGEWDEAFDVLRANREAKGRPMNLELDYLRRARHAFGDRIRMAVLRDGGAVVAAALLYRADPGREVVVRWGDHGHQLPHSPMYLLAERVVDLVGGEGAARLDLGISTDGGVPNPGLVQFKRAVGAAAELRLDLVRRW